MRLASVRIFVEDLAEAATFYESVVGLTRSTSDAAAVIFEHSPRVIIEAANDEARREGLVGRFTGISFETRDVAALHANLKSRGIPTHGPPEKQYWGGIMLFADDPSGNTVAFIEMPTDGQRRSAEVGNDR